MHGTKMTIVAGLLLIGPIRLSAQVRADSATKKTQDSLKQAVAPDTSAGSRALFTRYDLLYTAGLFGGTALISVLDKPIAENLGDSTKIPSPFRKGATTALNFFGVPGSFILAGGMFAVGRIGRLPGLARTGVHAGEALVITEVVTEAFKLTFGRERPYFSGAHDPNNFGLGRGFKGDVYSSFPSGHASSAFALAATVTAEIHARWPKATVFIAPVLYTGAAMVGWARLADNKHWISDVFMGAGIGTLVGVKVVRYTHKHPNNWVDRILVGEAPTIVPSLSGGPHLNLLWTWRPRVLEGGLSQY